MSNIRDRNVSWLELKVQFGKGIAVPKLALRMHYFKWVDIG